MTTIPCKLYKYFDVAGAQKTLDTCTLKYSLPNALNDPFEFMPGGYIESMQDKIQRVLPLLESDSRLGNTQQERHLYLENHPLEVEQFATLSFQYVAESVNWTELVECLSLVFVLTCFSENADNILMWSHYAEQHKGIVIGFNTKKFDKLSKVKYSNARVKVPLNSISDKQHDVAFDVMSTKSSDWQYEFEWRRIVFKNELIQNGNILLGEFQPEAITEIILGMKTDSATENYITGVKSKFSQCKLFKAQADKSLFRMDISAMET